MLKRLLGKTIEGIPSPSIRLNILMPTMALFVLATVITILWHNLGKETTDQLRAKDIQIEYWQHQSEMKDHRIDSMNTKAYNDKIETNIELRSIIDKQNIQKKLLRNLK